MTLLEREVESQPAAVGRLMETQALAAQRLAAELRASGVSWVMIAARGSSDNAARYGQYLLGARLRVPVALAAPSLFTIYASPPRLRDALVIGISQSGEAPDVLAVVSEANRQGCLTAVITSDRRSPLGQAGRHVLELGVRERAVAATMTYTTSLAALALVAAFWEGSDEERARLEGMPQAMSEALDHARAQGAAVRRLPLEARWVVLGRGFAYSVAYEIALKLKEVAGVAVEPYSTADFMHGPIAAVDQHTVAVLVAPEGPTQASLVSLAGELADRGASTVAISNCGPLLESAAVGFLVPSVPEWLSPLVTVIPGQVLAFETALALGLDPDLPRGLSKVTRTL